MTTLSQIMMINLCPALAARLLKLTCCVMAILWAGLAAADPVGYRFSPVNQWDISKTAAYWNPIIEYVSEKSGIKLQLKIGRTSADTTR